jgi:hypothetical protein
VVNAKLRLARDHYRAGTTPALSTAYFRARQTPLMEEVDKQKRWVGIGDYYLQPVQPKPQGIAVANQAIFEMLRKFFAHVNCFSLQVR